MSIICYPADSDDSDDDESGPPTPSSSVFPYPDSPPEPRLLTLADISDPATILVPLLNLKSLEDNSPEPPLNSLSVITVSGSGVDIAPLPKHNIPSEMSTLPPPEEALSAETVFRLPEVSLQVILGFYQRAISVSRYARHFSTDDWNRSRAFRPGSAKVAQKMVGLTSPQFRELCTDVYDELVRRNVEEKNKSKGNSTPQASFREPEGLHPKRVVAREKLRWLPHSRLLDLISDIVGELKKRSLGEEMGRAAAAHGYVPSAARLSAVLGQE